MAQPSGRDGLKRSALMALDRRQQLLGNNRRRSSGVSRSLRFFGCLSRDILQVGLIVVRRTEWLVHQRCSDWPFVSGAHNAATKVIAAKRISISETPAVPPV